MLTNMANTTGIRTRIRVRRTLTVVRAFAATWDPWIGAYAADTQILGATVAVIAIRVGFTLGPLIIGPAVGC